MRYHVWDCKQIAGATNRPKVWYYFRYRIDMILSTQIMIVILLSLECWLLPSKSEWNTLWCSYITKVFVQTLHLYLLNSISMFWRINVYSKIWILKNIIKCEANLLFKSYIIGTELVFNLWICYLFPNLFSYRQIM